MGLLGAIFGQRTKTSIDYEIAQKMAAKRDAKDKWTKDRLQGEIDRLRIQRKSAPK